MSKAEENLIKIYKEMSPERREEEIHALFEIAYAMLEATECDALESYPNPSVKLTIKCEVLKDGSRYYN